MQNEITVYKAPVREGKKHVVISFPKDILKYLKLSGKEVVWAPMNGTIQIIGGERQIAVPLLSMEKEGFVQQT